MKHAHINWELAMGPNKKYAQSIYGDEPKTMDELGFAVIKILNEYRERRIAKVNRKTVCIESPNARCVGLSWQVTHSEQVSNSHSSPEGYPQNFMRKEGVPTSYPGWKGRVWVRYENKQGYSFGSDPFKRSLTHTGTGGGGAYDGPWESVSHARWIRHGHSRDVGLFPEVNCFSWDFRIYDADWPLVTENIIDQFEKEVMWATLSNQAVPRSPQHKFLWEDPATQVADETFLEECRSISQQVA